MKLGLRLMGLCLIFSCAVMLSCCRRKAAVQAGDDEMPEGQLSELPVEAEEEAAPEEEADEGTSAETVRPAPPPLADGPAGGAESVLAAGSEVSENPDYKDGNGTVLSYVESDWVRKIIRKCEMDITIGGMISDAARVVYGDMEKEDYVATLQDGDSISLLQQCTLEYLQEQGNAWGGVRGDLWYKVLLADGTDGWICTNNGYLSGEIPYYGNNYEVLGTVSAGGRKWTVRKMEQTLSVWENLSIRDKPGTGGSSVLCTIRPGKSDPPQTNVQVTAITEEDDTQDGITDRWIKIRYGDYEGWVFGAYLSAERGGPKYYLPEQMIAFDLGDY